MDWLEVRCKRDRGGEHGSIPCNRLLGYLALRDGYAMLWCPKCKAWAIHGGASFLPPELPEGARMQK